MNFSIGFKQKLWLAVIFTLVGFLTLSVLSITSLNLQSAASENVDGLNQQQTHLYRLKLELMDQVARLQTQDEGATERLDRFYQDYKAIVSPGGPAGIENDVLEKLLFDWVSARKEWLAASDALGRNSNSGLRGQMKESMALLGDGLFADMKNRFQVIREAFDLLIDHKDKQSLLKVEEALEHFQQLVVEQNFEEFFNPKIEAVQTPLEQFGAQLIQLGSSEHQALSSKDQLLNIINDQMAKRSEMLSQARVSANSASGLASKKIVMSGVLIGGVVLGLLLLAHRQASQTLHQAVDSLAKISAGDLTQRLNVDERRNDEFDQVGCAVNQLTETLSDVLSQVVSGSAGLQSMSGELKLTIDKMVNGNQLTYEQAEMVATAIEEISATVSDMSGSSEESHQQSLKTGEVAENGGKVISNALETMETITLVFDGLNKRGDLLGQASSKVDGVTDMINDLASQTNLLALNAAIEAARAGEAGRGFSVVADEVRRLAEKTVEATSEIDLIISDMQKQLRELMTELAAGATNVVASRELGDDAAKAVNQIRTLVNQSSDRSSQLSVNIEEIVQTSVSVSGNMTDVVDSTHQGHQLGLEVLVFAEKVEQLSSQQKNMTDNFKFK